MRYFIYSLNFLFLFFAVIPFCTAFSFSIKGSATGLTDNHVRISCSAWFEERVIPVSPDGSFEYSGNQNDPVMLTVTYGEGFQLLKADMFILDNIEIELEMISSEEEERVLLRIPSHRSSGFKKAQDFMDHIYVGKSTHPSVTDNILDMIKGQPYIGEDTLTQVYALSEKLNYLLVLKEDYGKNISQDIFEMDEFYSLPINDKRFLGLRSYKNLMVRYNEKVIADTTYRPQGVDNYESEFGKQIFVLDSYKKGIPKLIRVEVIKNLLKRFPYGPLSNKERNIYIEKLVDITNNYPNGKDAKDLMKQLALISNSLENTLAPPFELISNKGEPVHLNTLLNQSPIVIDVWGSWCRPCRVHNRRLVELKADCEEKGLDIQFVSIAKETDFSAWRAAIKADKMDWTQLRANDTFIKEYNIHQFPTVILLDRSGVVRKVGASVTMEELRNL